HRAELAKMHRLAQVEVEVPARAKSEGDDVLRFLRKIAMDALVKLPRLVHARAELVREARPLDLRREVVPVGGREVLTLLREEAVALEVAIGAEVRHDVERVRDVLERPRRLVAAVKAGGGELTERRGAIRRRKTRGERSEIAERLRGVRIEKGGEEAILRVGV